MYINIDFVLIKSDMTAGDVCSRSHVAGLVNGQLSLC